ncbi:MAG: methionyl-tRNA formyltransferase [Lentisphaeria bacterium]|nr:methionyl-tRNA formyltransferase [Lentisphaeria bacterium]
MSIALFRKNTVILKADNQQAGGPAKVYFLGSGELGIPALRAIHESPDVTLVGVGTQPDRPSGRHRHLHSTPLGAAAVALGLCPDKPVSVNAADFIARLSDMSPDVLLVVSYGQILRSPVLALPACGCVNVHASLLPRHRGASPIQAAILAGDTETGVTFMRMDEGLDTGGVYTRVTRPLDGTETTLTLEKDLAELAGEHIVGVIQSVVTGNMKPVPQDDSLATLAKKIKKSQGEIMWTRTAGKLECQVRAFTPWPHAWFYIPAKKGRKRIHIIAASVEAGNHGAHTPGEVVQADQHGWIIACGGDRLRILRVVPEGRPEMSAEEFLRGTRIAVGDILPMPDSA